MGSATVEPAVVATIEGWQMALLLLAFATVTFILERTMHFLEHAFKSKRGLSIALEHIKNELLCVGSISLLLSAFQNLLAKICIPLSEMSVYSDRRRSLASGSTDYCGPSKQSLWPVSLQHDTHIFIFVVACTHIVYGTCTVYLTIWRVKSWAVWERECQVQGSGGDLVPMKMPAKFLYKNVGSNPVIHFFLMLVRQYQISVNQSLYSNARLLFIEKMGLEYDFNFHEVVIKGLETELMTTLHPEWHLWLIAVVWYAIPPPAYVSFWMYGLSVLVIVLVGGKLVDILVQLSVQVAIKYGNSVVFGRMDSNPLAHAPTLGRSSLRAPAIIAPDIQKRFIDHVADWLVPWASGAVGGADADAGGNRDGAASGGATAAAALDPGATAASDPPAGAGSGQATRPSLASGLSMQASREFVVRMLRTMASQVSEGSGRSGGAGGGDAAAAAAGHRQQQPEACPSAARLPEADSLPEAASVTVALPLPPPSPPPPPPAAARENASALPSRRLGLARGSAPAAVRRSHAAHNPLHFQFMDHTSGAAAGVGAAAAAAAARLQGSASGRRAGGSTRNLSVIVESRAGSQLAATPAEVRFIHRHRHSMAHSRHRHAGHTLSQAQSGFGSGGGGSDKASPPRSPPRPNLHHHHHHHHHHQAPTHGSPAASGAAANHQPPTAHKRSVFEIFQRNSTEDRPRALSTLRRNFAALGGPSGDEGAAAAGTPPSPLSPRRHPHRTSQQSGGGRTSLRTSHERSTASGGGAVAATTAAVVLVDGSNGGGGGDGSVAKGSVGGAGSAGAEGPSPLPALPAAAREEEDDGCSSHDDYHGGCDCSGGGRRRRWALRLRRTPSGRHKVPLVMRPFYCGAEYIDGHKKYVKELLQRRKERGVQLLDAKEFFWFKRPRFMTALFTLAYFQNSLSIAICIFSLAGLQDSVSTWQDVPNWAIILQLCLDVILVPQVSLAILPFYALIQPLGSHCPQDLLELARLDRKPRITGHKKIGARFNSRMTDLSNHFRAMGKGRSASPCIDADSTNSASVGAGASSGTKRNRSLLSSLSALLLPGRALRKNTSSNKDTSNRRNGDDNGDNGASGRPPAVPEENEQEQGQAQGGKSWDAAGPMQPRVGSQAVAAAAAFVARNAKATQSYQSPMRPASAVLSRLESAPTARSRLAEPGPAGGGSSAAGSPVIARVSASLDRDPQLVAAHQAQQQQQQPGASSPAAAGADGSSNGRQPQPQEPAHPPQVQVVVDSQPEPRVVAGPATLAAVRH